MEAEGKRKGGVVDSDPHLTERNKTERDRVSRAAPSQPVGSARATEQSPDK